MITATLVGDEAVIARLRAMHPALMARLRTTVSRLAFDLQAHVVRDKLSGQVLGKYLHGHATNRLRNSINVASLLAGDNAVMARVGTNVVYAAIHEYGFSGSETVRSFQRRQTQAFGRPLNPAIMVQVRSFTRQMNMPERSFLRSSLKDMAADIRAAIAADVAAVAQG